MLQLNVKKEPGIGNLGGNVHLEGFETSGRHAENESSGQGAKNSLWLEQSEEGGSGRQGHKGLGSCSLGPARGIGSILNLVVSHWMMLF